MDYNIELIDSSNFHKDFKSELFFNIKKILKKITI